jgi:hypothetical protein
MQGDGRVIPPAVFFCPLRRAHHAKPALLPLSICVENPVNPHEPEHIRRA